MASLCMGVVRLRQGPCSATRRQNKLKVCLHLLCKGQTTLSCSRPRYASCPLQVFNLDTKQKLKSYQVPESVEFWKWISPTVLGLVTGAAVYHWDIEVRLCCAPTLCMHVQLCVWWFGVLCGMP
jgi:hypothetical protein